MLAIPRRALAISAYVRRSEGFRGARDWRSYLGQRYSDTSHRMAAREHTCT